MIKALKNSLERLLSVSMVLIMLIGAFAGCGDAMNGNKKTTPSVNADADPGDLSGDDKEENEDDPTRVFTIAPLEPLSKKKQAEVEEAWKKVDGNVELHWTNEYVSENTNEWCKFGDKYYGTYNGCVIILTQGALTEDNIIEVAGHTISHPYIIEMWAYANGKICSTETAYEINWLSDSDISEIVSYHNDLWKSYIEPIIVPRYEENVFTLDSLEPLSQKKQAEVESAWDEKMDGKLSWRRRINVDHFTVTKHRYYGTYNDCIVIFEIIIDAIGTINIDGGIEVGGQKIKSYYLENVWIYYNGEFYDIRIAYENKLLTDSDISAIVKYNDEYEEYVERNK